MNPVSNLTLEEIDQRIARTAVEAAIEIGYYLKQIRDRKLYEQAGCQDVFEYARKQYGYDRSTTSRNMSRNDRFSVGGNSPELAEKYRGYGKNQLQEMISMTPEQLEQATPAMTVREMRELKKKPEKAEETEQRPVATSQQNRKDSCPPDSPGCIRQEWGFSAEQQERGRKECAKCWDHWKQLHVKDQSEPEEKNQDPPKSVPVKEQKLSAYGLPALEYPPDSLVAASGCGKCGGILHHCFSCRMNNCQIRQKECYCVEAPMGNPFPCGTLLIMEQEHVRRTVGNHPCQFLDHDLADHRTGDGAAVPCCKHCTESCRYRCSRSSVSEEKTLEESIINGECREMDASQENNLYREASDKTDLELIQEELNRVQGYLEAAREGFAEDDLRVRKQKVIIAALEEFIRTRKEQEPQEDRIQPELPVLRNNDQRKEWLRNYKDWGLWYEDENIGAKYYKYDFANGARLIAEVYQEPETKHVPAYESSHLHLVGGPEPPRNGFLNKWTRHERYSRYPNSETELVEFLKEVQRNG